jgi:hypothetical protein
VKSAISVTKATRTASLVITLDGGEPNQPFRVDWGDGSALTTIASGAHAGPTTHVYATVGTFNVAVQGNDLRTTDKVYIPDTLRAYDPLKIAEQQRDISQQNERDKAKVIMGQRGFVG